MSANSSSSSSFYSPYLFACSEKSTLQAFTEHVFDASFNGRKELMNMLQYGFVSAAVLMPLLAGVDAVIPEVSFHTHTILLMFEICAQLLLQMLVILFVHRVVTFMPTISGVQYAPVSPSAALIPFLVVMFTLHTKLSAKATIVGDRWRHYWQMRPRRLPSRAGAAATTPSSGLDGIFAASATSVLPPPSPSLSAPASTSSSPPPSGAVALGSLPYQSLPPASSVLGSGW